MNIPESAVPDNKPNNFLSPLGRVVTAAERHPLWQI
jgi:hypothetical protein